MTMSVWTAPPGIAPAASADDLFAEGRLGRPGPNATQHAVALGGGRGEGLPSPR